MPIRRVTKAFLERLRLQRLKREHEQYLKETPPRQFRKIIGQYDGELESQIKELARRLQPRQAESLIRGIKYTEEEQEILEAMKQRLAEIYEQMEEEHRKQLLAAALHMGGHGPPYEELAKHTIAIAKAKRHI
ncbi:MAG: hypothetical protein GXN93_02760 [Candidatus Diapherotrites archaeon]|nr:hypothetical protein [Candidatus Diapherotrites archaeon]